MARRLNFLKGTWEDIPEKKKRKAPERDVGKVIDDYLRLQMKAYVREIKTTGTIRNGKWTKSQMGKGISDRLFWLNNGRHGGIELKAPGEKNTTTIEQYKFLRELIERGHYGCVADCLEDVQAMFLQDKEKMLAVLEQWNPEARKQTEFLDNTPLFDD